MKNLFIVLSKVLDFLNENVWVIIAIIFTIILASVIIIGHKQIEEEKKRNLQKEKEYLEFELGKTKSSSMQTKENKNKQERSKL